MTNGQAHCAIHIEVLNIVERHRVSVDGSPGGIMTRSSVATLRTEHSACELIRMTYTDPRHLAGELTPRQ